MSLKSRSLVSINDFTKEEQLQVLELAQSFEKNPVQDILKEKVVATLFFEPSTRTRLSFESAVSRLGGKIIGVSDVTSSSLQKGESFRDTIKTISNYSDLIVIRHPKEGSARFASEVSSVPVINAGDGANQHPTQTLLDLFTINQTQGKLDELNVAFVGDLKYGRTVHSLVMALCNFSCTFHFVSPVELKLPDSVKFHIKERKQKYFEYTKIEDVIKKVDILYMTRIQKERFSDPIEYEKIKNSYVLKNDMLEDTKENLRILHPMPRVNEISEDVDDSIKAYYFQQAMNGVYVRQALMSLILGVK
ncbi:MAG: aspartate carbamoyltransferase [Bacteroidales bacterium]|nr:aspartate carbamoyltransferase [Bacteroidales bacterium]